MATSTCPKCPGKSFEVKNASPIGSNYQVMFIQCATCGAVVGAQDYYSIGQMLVQQNKALKEIARKIGVSVSLD